MKSSENAFMVKSLPSGKEFIIPENRLNVPTVRVANATGKFVGQVREAVTARLKSIAASCFERDVFTLDQSRELLESVRERWREELEFLWDDYPECAILRRTDTGKWYAVMMSLPKRKFGLPIESEPTKSRLSFFARKTYCTTRICEIAAVSVSFANGKKRRENVSLSLFSGDEEGRVLLV